MKACARAELAQVAQCSGAGAHEVSKLNELLESFTKKYVQCHQCGNPETRIRIKKEMIYLKCKVTTAGRWGLLQQGCCNSMLCSMRV